MAVIFQQVGFKGINATPRFPLTVGDYQSLEKGERTRLKWGILLTEARKRSLIERKSHNMNTLIHFLHVRFLVLFLCGSATLFSASVADLEYEIIGNAITITDCAHGAQGALIIPSQIKGAPVTKIGILAFEGVTNLTQIVLPDTLTEIADGAFLACPGLTSFNFPDSVVSIGENAFAGCDNLINIYFEGAAPSTGADPFSGVRANAYVEPSHVQSFGGYGVQWNGLSVEEILFSYVVDGSAITITDYPEDSQGVLTIPATMFGKPVTKIGAYTFQNCGALTKILIPESVTQIEFGAFRECSSLTGAVIPDSVTSLGNGVFSLCPNLSTVTLSKNLTVLPPQLFYQCTALESLSIPVGVTGIGGSAFNGCTNLKDVVIPESVLAIGNSAFNLCGLEELNLPHSLSEIGPNAFRNCRNLVRIFVPENVTNIDDRAFQNCSDLLGVEFSNQSFSLGSEVFEGCSSLRGLYFSGPAPVITAGTAGIALPTRIVVSEDHQDSFGGYGAIWNGLPVEPGNEQSIYYQYLEYPSSVTITDYWEGIAGELVIPDEMFLKPVTAIAQNAFRDCAALTRIVIPEGVTDIGSGAFRDCRNLESLEIPASAEVIAAPNAILGCVSLTNLTVQEANQIYQSINGVLLQDGGRKAIGFAQGRSTVTIPSGVTTIMPGAFFGSIHLTNVVIPESVVSVESTAFKGCSNLLSITIPENVTYFGSEVFHGATNFRFIVFSGSAPIAVIGNSFGVSAIAVVNEIHAPSFGGDGALWNGLTVRVRSDQPSEVLLLQLLSSPDYLLFNARGLAQGAAYQIQSSADLQLWSSFHDFTATGDRELVTLPRPEVEGLYFRLHEISEQVE